MGIRSEKKHCVFCDEETIHAPFGTNLRYAVMCVNCKALERHKSLHHILKNYSLLKDRDKLLFMSPDPSLLGFLKDHIQVDTSDYGGGRNVDLDIDITDIKVDDEKYDVVIALHILEHIPDDITAIKEIKRILKKDGLFIVMIPQNLNAEHTIEDEIKNPVSRIIKYGQHDHVRRYGRDFTNRVSDAGFHVSVYTKPRPLIKDQMFYDEYIEIDENCFAYVFRKIA